MATRSGDASARLAAALGADLVSKSDPASEVDIYVVDPLGNLMMRFPAGLDHARHAYGPEKAVETLEGSADVQLVRKTPDYLALGMVLCVIVLGAWVRLTDAGLGCPDWPGCYGYIVLPADEVTRAEAQIEFPERPLDAGKAWREMIHRYLAAAAWAS